MAQVDLDDDTLWRWVIQHYRFDPTRNERRNVVVSVFDNAAEFETELHRYAVRVHAEITAGTRSGRENVSGLALHLGYQAEQARAHAARRAISHGADPRRLLSNRSLPPNIAVFDVDHDGTPFSSGGMPPQPPPQT